MTITIQAKQLEGHPNRIELVATVVEESKGTTVTKHRNIDDGTPESIHEEKERFRNDILSGKA